MEPIGNLSFPCGFQQHSKLVDRTPSHANPTEALTSLDGVSSGAEAAWTAHLSSTTVLPAHRAHPSTTDTQQYQTQSLQTGIFLYSQQGPLRIPFNYDFEIIDTYFLTFSHLNYICVIIYAAMIKIPLDFLKSKRS